MKTRLFSMLAGCVVLTCAPFAAKSASANPRGMKLNVRAFFTITNSDDGFRDDTVETYGEVLFGSWQIWKIARKNAADKKSNDFMNAGDFTVNVMFDEPRTSKIFVSGFLSDRDKGLANGDDKMWNPSRKTRELNIKDIYESGGQGGRNRIYKWKGDRDSESADLTLVVSKIGDIN